MSNFFLNHFNYKNVSIIFSNFLDFYHSLSDLRKVLCISILVSALILLCIICKPITYIKNILPFRVAYLKLTSTIPRPGHTFFWGIALDIMKESTESRFCWFNELCLKADIGITESWLIWKRFLCIRKPEEAKVILTSNTNISKSGVYDIIKPWLGDGLVTSTGELWYRHRKIITDAFKTPVLNEYATVMNQKMRIFSECIRDKVKSNPGKPINIFELTVNYSLDVICETAMGVNSNAQRSVHSEYIRAVQTVGDISIDRFYNPWYSWDFTFNLFGRGKEFKENIATMHEFTDSVIREKQNARRNGNHPTNITYSNNESGKAQAFLDLLLDLSENTERPFTHIELRNEVETFTFAGHDTTSTAIGWSLFAIGNNPSVQQKLHQELEEVFGQSSAMATVKQLAQLPYLDLVIKEVFRLYPPVPMIGRCLDEDIRLAGFLIEKGTIVNVNIFLMHRDPEYWDGPLTFNPDRFLSAGPEKNVFKYIPFSAGKRGCIGRRFALLEIKTTLVAILREWRIKSHLTPSQMQLVQNFTLKPHQDVIDVYFTPINDEN